MTSTIETTLQPWKPGLGMSAFDDAANYIGTNLAGWFVISKHRDSDLLSQSNYDCALRELQSAADASGVDCVEQHTFGHWAFGHVDQLVLSAESPESVIRRAEELLSSLADYPVLDESDWSEREWNAQAEYWDSMSARDKVREAKHILSRAWWLADKPSWFVGRLSFDMLAHRGDNGCEVCEAVYSYIRDTIR